MDDPCAAKARPRDRIVDTASGLFRKHGIRGIGVDAIAEAAGTNKMTLYRHFGSKDELIASGQWPRGTLGQPGPGPFRQFARVGEQAPNALGWSQNDVGRTDVHMSATVAVYLYKWKGGQKVCAHVPRLKSNRVVA